MQRKTQRFIMMILWANKSEFKHWGYKLKQLHIMKGTKINIFTNNDKIHFKYLGNASADSEFQFAFKHNDAIIYLLKNNEEKLSKKNFN